MPLAVLASDATPQEKLFVLAIYHHDWDGEKAWPSMARISKITSFSPRTLERARKALEARGWLKVDPRIGRSNNYSLDIPDMTLDECNAALSPRHTGGGIEADPRPTDGGTPATQTEPPRPTGAPLNNRAIEREPGEPSSRGQAPSASDPQAKPTPVFNPFGYLMAAFKALPSPPIVTERSGVDVGRVNTKARKLGEKDFKRIVDAYCKDEYPGKSIPNFLMGFDRLANKLLGAEREVRARRQRELKTLFTELREQPNG